LWILLGRILTSMTGWIKNIMSTEQKKSDFRPEEHGVGLVERTMVIDLSWSLKGSIQWKEQQVVQLQNK